MMGTDNRDNKMTREIVRIEENTEHNQVLLTIGSMETCQWCYLSQEQLLYVAAFRCKQ